MNKTDDWLETGENKEFKFQFSDFRQWGWQIIIVLPQTFKMFDTETWTFKKLRTCQIFAELSTMPSPNKTYNKFHKVLSKLWNQSYETSSLKPLDVFSSSLPTPNHRRCLATVAVSLLSQHWWWSQCTQSVLGATTPRGRGDLESRAPLSAEGPCAPQLSQLGEEAHPWCSWDLRWGRPTGEKVP